MGAHDGMGCGYYRMILPLQQMARHGHHVELFQQGKDLIQHSLGRADEFDVIVGQRFVSYKGLPSWRKARRPGNRLVYENDDDLFNVTMENWQAYQTFQKADVREAIRAYCECSDLLTVTTPYLAEVWADSTPGDIRISVLPNFIPEWVLGDERERTERPRIGWAGAANHGLDIHEASKAVRRFLRRMPGWDMYIGGTDYRPSFNARNWDQMIYGGWTQVNDDAQGFYRSYNFDIGIVPVRDTVFARSKSYVKALEYNARGIPVIASDIEPYRAYIREGENGFLVKHEHEWLSRLMELANDEKLREDMSSRSKEIAAEYTIEGNWKLWENAYESLFA